MRENSMWAFYENEVRANPESVFRTEVWERLAKRYLYPRTKRLEAGARENDYRMINLQYSALQIAMTVLIREHLRKALSVDRTMFTTGAGKMLKKLYSFGGTEYWDGVIQKVTGEPLTGESAAIYFNSVLRSKP
jgi:hypothetical protein